MSNPTKQSQLLKVEQVLELLNVSRATLYREIERGHIHRIYVSGCPRFDRREIEAYIQRHTEQRTPRRRRAA